MSYELETLNKGLVGEFGFWGPFTGVIRMGKLPEMPLETFCEYATQTLGRCIGLVEPSLREQMIKQIKEVFQSVSNLKVVEGTTGPLIYPIKPTPECYRNNPFIPTGGHIAIGEAYTVSFKHFTDFCLYVLGGGFLGWDEDYGIPRCAKNSFERLLGTIQQ